MAIGILHISDADVSGEDSVASFVDQCSSIQQGMTTTITATITCIVQL